MFMTLGLKVSHLQVKNMAKRRFFERLDAQGSVFFALECSLFFSSYSLNANSMICRNAQFVYH